jgi:hypothetical protein
MANEWNKTALVAEFETMLRRHLRSGAAPVAACAGFDLDAASAYLEGALDEWRRASYESHLAGCAICRRHLIELARLAQAAPSFEPQPVRVLDQAPAWVRWREVVTGWFDISTRKLKWQIAGATGAAFAILIAALGVQSWRQASYKDVAAVNGASAIPPPAAEPAVQTLPLPTPTESLPQNADTLSAQDLAVNNPARPGAVPAPSVGPVASAPKFAFNDSSAGLVLSESQPTVAPVPANEGRLTAAEQKAQRLSGQLGEMVGVANTASGGAQTRRSAPPRSNISVQLNDLSVNSESIFEEFKEAPEARAAQETADGPNIIPRYQPDLIRSRSEPPSKSQPNKSLSQQAVESMRKMIRRISPSVKSGFDSDTDRKEIPDTQGAPDDETPKPMQVLIRGKIFNFEKGMLTDREYKPEMQKWNVWTLKRGSEEYKKVLGDEPRLKEFFDRAPILIVWGDRIYKVLK